MKNKILYVTVLALASSAIAAAPIMMQAQDQNSSTITIKDPAEFNAYNTAINQSTPQAKEASIEAFLQQYPNSVVKKQVLEILMDAYTQTGNTNKAVATARQVLQMDPTDMRALALSAYVLRQQAGQKTNPADALPLLDEAAKDAQAGLNAPAPEGADAANFGKMKAAVQPIFDGAIAADDLEKKNYSDAIEYFRRREYRPCARSSSRPADREFRTPAVSWHRLYGAAAGWPTQSGTWPAPLPLHSRTLQGHDPEGRKCAADAGGVDGAEQVQAQAKASLNPPSGFTSTPAPPPPSPQELAHNAVTSTPDLKTMALTDKEFVGQWLSGRCRQGLGHHAGRPPPRSRAK